MIDPAWVLYPVLLYPIFEAVHVRIRRIELRFSALPLAWDGLTILYVSDSHTRRWGRRERRLERLVSGLTVDLLVLGGDIGGRPEEYKVFLNLLDRVEDRLGRYATWGNAEERRRANRKEEIRELLVEQGYVALVNDYRLLERGGSRIALSAVSCPHSEAADFDAALAGIPASTFTVLLMHAPEGLLQIGRYTPDLILSGHTHGGQIRVPGLPAASLHTETEVDLDRGVFGPESLRRFWPGAPEGTRMVVSAGMGTSTFPVRAFCPSEALHITLRRAPPATP